MLPFEFTIKGPPVSHQTKNRTRLRSWKNDVGIEAQRELGASSDISAGDISVTITYFYENSTPDVDNVVKPILDALIGICYNDDSQVKEAKSRQKKIDRSYKIRGVSAVILNAFSDGDEFLHIRLEEYEDSEVLE